MRHIESYHQQAYFAWLEHKHRKVYELATANASGGKRNKIEAARLKREGVAAGWPDIQIMWPLPTKYHGLFIELKAPKGKPTKLQIEMIKKLNDKGYCAGICYGSDEAIEATHNYLYGHVVSSYPNWIYNCSDTYG